MIVSLKKKVQSYEDEMYIIIIIMFISIGRNRLKNEIKIVQTNKD